MVTDESAEERVIWKHLLQPMGSVRVPYGQVLHIGQQDDDLYAWISHTITSSGDLRYQAQMILTARGTGQPYNPGYALHVGSAVCPPFVWHVFQETT